MLSQLIHNAVKYSKGKSKSISISIYDRGGEAVLEVKDYGVGIPESDKQRVFEPFYTGENGRKFRESTGMGLYLTSEAAKQLGHRIEIDSKAGEGTTIRIIFSVTQNITTL
jgi:two-component system, OmpR family, sensor histidine kinase YxdK